MSAQIEFYRRWVDNRFYSIDTELTIIFGDDFLKNKTLLELGAYDGNFGNKFYQKGAIVTCYEGRQENLDQLKVLHPQFDSYLVDMDKTKVDKKFDIILHAGLLYHMKNVEDSLINSLQNCDVLILETENIDSDDMEIDIEFEGSSQTCNVSSLTDSDLTDYVSRTSRNYLEKIFEDNGFNFKLVSNSKSNTHPYQYDWVSSNSKSKYALRSIYIAWNKNFK
jgi:hypothetical protein